MPRNNAASAAERSTAVCIFFISRTVEGEYINGAYPAAIYGDDARATLVGADDVHGLATKERWRFATLVNGWLLLEWEHSPGVLKTKQDLLGAIACPFVKTEADARLAHKFGSDWWTRLSIYAVHAGGTEVWAKEKNLDWFVECRIDQPVTAATNQGGLR